MSERCFWDDLIKEAPICQDLLSNYEQIKKEVLAFVKDPAALHDYPKYKVHYNNKEYDLYDHYWKAVPMSRYENEYIDQKADGQQLKIIEAVIAKSKMMCPTVDRIISKLEKEGNLANSFISRLIPGSVIHPHDGTTKTFMRIHLCLVADPGCKITVGNETRTWEEGKLLAFKDGGPLLHSVKHDGVSERIVLSVDVRIDPILRPYMK